MLSLQQYAAGVYEFASREVITHLAQTVLVPMGLCSEAEGSRAAYLATFALPPITTNVRFTGGHVTEEAASVASSGDAADPHLSPPVTLESVGLPYCLCLRPRLEQLREWPDSLSHGDGQHHDGGGASSADAAGLVVVTVDPGCAEAVLRGADVFVPGIVSASAHFTEGQRVVLVMRVEKTAAPEHASEANESSSPTFRFKFAKGSHLPPELLAACDKAASCGASTGGRPLGVHASSEPVQDTLHYVVIIGEGIARADRRSILSRAAHGVGVETTWTPFLQPSQSAIQRAIGCSARPHENGCNDNSGRAGAVFLQNYSSMVPVQLLVGRIRAAPLATARPLRLLDACAAPGGKTSLLLSCMKAVTEAAPSPAFHLVCCERSQPRFKALVNLLHAHFPDVPTEGGSDSFLSHVLHAACCDVNKLSAASVSGLCGADNAALEGTFDGILLDPPCTGLGLRPRLQPHTHTLHTIRDHADYQRVLFRKCLRLLRGPSTAHNDGDRCASGVLVYSTCTITLEENEANVLQLLQDHPTLKLVRARTPEERAICSMRALGSVGTAEGRFLLEKEIMHVQREREALAGAGAAQHDAAALSAPVLVLRFMPRPEQTASGDVEDTVGFFVAVFERFARAE